MVLVLARKVGGLLVTESGRCLLDGAAISQQFKRLALALLGQPSLGALTHLLAEEAVQCAHRDAAFLRQCDDRPIGLPRQFRPVFNMPQASIHAGSPSDATSQKPMPNGLERILLNNPLIHFTYSRFRWVWQGLSCN